jgi:hypothetical protein
MIAGYYAARGLTAEGTPSEEQLGDLRLDVLVH